MKQTGEPGFLNPFDPERCDLCGRCLEACPVLRLPAGEAGREMAGMVREGRRSRALTACTSCYDCDFACPNGANPSGFFLESWRREYQARGRPERARYFMPHDHPNFRTYVMERLPADERAILKKWADPTPAEEICYPGCNVIMTPYLTRTSLLEGLDIRGTLDHCCGEMYYRMGQLDTMAQVVERMDTHFRRMGVRRMVIMCTAGYYMFTRVHPHLGAEYDFEIEPYLSWLWKRVEKGEVRFTRPLDLTVTVQDSCYAKFFGPEYLELPRKLLEAAGARVVEMRDHGETMRCCGIGSGFSVASAYHPLRMTASIGRNLAQARGTGAQAMCVYCSGCLQTYSLGKLLLPFPMPVFHLLELLQKAVGEEPARRQASRAFATMRGMVRHQFPALLSRKRFHMEPLGPLE